MGRQLRAGIGHGLEMLVVPVARGAGEDVEPFEMAGRLLPLVELALQRAGKGRDILGMKGHDGSRHRIFS